MKKNKNKMSIWLAAMAMSMAIVGCSNAKTATTAAATTAQSTEAVATNTSAKTTASYSEEDLNTSYSDSDTKIELSSGNAKITGEGASYTDGNIVITKAGTYVFSGEFNGQIITEVGDEDLVHIVFNGVNITNTTSSVINAATGRKIVLTLVDGTTNTITDGTTYNYAEGEDEPDATLFVKQDLTINGNGTLNISSNYATALKAKDNLIILGGKLNIESVGKAIKGTDSVTIENADITINVEDDGITTDGALVINSGTIKMEKVGEGLEAVTIDINGGTIDIVATNDFTAVILSSDKLVTGETYTVSAGSNSEEITITAGENSIGTQSGGMGFGGGNGAPPSGAPSGNGTKPSGQPPEKPTDANGNELAMPEPPSGQGSNSESN